MDALDVLQRRVSVTNLIEPAPTEQQLLPVLKAAARAADHGRLKPWRFLVIHQQGLVALSRLFADVLQKNTPDASPSVVEKTRNMPFRAPMIIVAIAQCQEHPKVPKQEQIIAVGAATQNILNALFALGFGAVWRTGEFAYDQEVKSALGLTTLEELIGFIYVGTPGQEVQPPPNVDPNLLFSYWPAK